MVGRKDGWMEGGKQARDMEYNKRPVESRQVEAGNFYLFPAYWIRLSYRNEIKFPHSFSLRADGRAGAGEL